MDHVEAAILRVIDRRSGELTAFARDIYEHAEPGFREFRTAGIVAEKLRALPAGARGTGGDRRAGRPARGASNRAKSVTVAALGELDGISAPSIPLPTRRRAFPHLGHHVQLTALLGAAFALSDEGGPSLSGRQRRLLLPCRRRSFPISTTRPASCGPGDQIRRRKERTHPHRRL